MKSRNFIYIAALISFVLCFIDFMVRLHIEDESTIKRDSYRQPDGTYIAFIEEADEKGLSEALSSFDVVDVPKTKPSKKANAPKPQIVLMSSEQQNQQAGQLVGLFDGEDEYKLVATFYDSKRRFALIKKTHLPSKAVSQVRIYEGESLSGYQLIRIENDYVHLQKNSREVQLQLFSRNS